jgi:peptidoglycan hydrolase-like protein with peptidoglycan-binding domain
MPIVASLLLVSTIQDAGAEPLGDYEASELWFNSLSMDERTNVQDLLIWTGDYNHLVDGTFGSSTHKAIRGYEKRNGSRADGALDSGELTALRRAASEEQQRVGFKQVYDDKWQLSLGLPTRKISKKETNNDGTLWESSDKRFNVTLIRSRYEGKDFAETYRNLIANDTFGNVAFSTFRPGFFILSGKYNGAQFYVRLHDDGGSVVGFVAFWDGRDAAETRKLIVAMSNSMAALTKSEPPQVINSPSSLGEERIIQQPLPAPTAPLQSGTGFFVTWSGNLVTNAHVVEGCSEAVLRFVDGREVKAVIAHREESIDLAILRTAVKPPSVAVFRSHPPLRLGSDVIVFGYPLLDLLTENGNLVSGLVSALAGPRNDASLIQITAPVQSGNSGGAVLDKSGHVIGVVAAKTNITGEGDQIEIIQLSNFAINGDVAKAYLIERGISPIEATSHADRPTADVADDARQFTAIVMCQPGAPR